MKKYILVSLFALIPTGVIADNKDCNDYWDPLIDNAENEYQVWFDRYKSESLLPHGLFGEKIKEAEQFALRYRDELDRLKKAKKICLTEGLQASKDVFHR